MTKRLLIVTCVALVVSVLGISTTNAMSKFKKAFDEQYVKHSDNAEFKAAFKKAGCYVCHIKGSKSKEDRNDYGEALAKLIPGDAKERLAEAQKAGATKEEGKELKAAEEEKILKELEEAFKKTEEMKSPTGETYGERIKEGKLPQDVVVKEKDEKKDN